MGGAERGTYQAAKHGVLGLTKSAALEYAARGGAHHQPNEPIPARTANRTLELITLDGFYPGVCRPRGAPSVRVPDQMSLV